MKDIVGMITLISALAVAAPALAGPMEDCATARRNLEQAYNDRNLDKLLSMYTKDVLYFGSTVNELMVGVDALRPFYAAAPRDLKIKPGELTAVQVAPNVLLCSGYQVLTSSNNESVLRLSFVLVNNNGTWLTAQAHFSRLPR